ncbi:MAG: ribonuclease III [Oscillospiraceae bacterium]|nr:ribonuclease III [Oscillospiraceae bacterium]
MEVSRAPDTGYSFRDPALLRTALTHSSFANEAHDRSTVCNERLEFLGDSVLNMLAAEYLYVNFALFAEGDLTKLRAALVCEGALHRIAKTIDLGSCLFLGHGEEHSGGRERPSVLADAMEAVLGAMYLDGGLEPVRRFLLPHFAAGAAEAAQKHTLRDYKTTLQEIVQKNKQEQIGYRISDAVGPEHDKTFTATLYLNSNPFTEGTGKSKKEAEQAAAKAALELMGEL